MIDAQRAMIDTVVVLGGICFALALLGAAADWCASLAAWVKGKKWWQ